MLELYLAIALFGIGSISIRVKNLQFKKIMM